MNRTHRNTHERAHALSPQAQDRAYRLGQHRNVQVYRLLATGTLEELVYRRQVGPGARGAPASVGGTNVQGGPAKPAGWPPKTLFQITSYYAVTTPQRPHLVQIYKQQHTNQVVYGIDERRHFEGVKVGRC